jgi:uncharacterized protein YuzB (UPF0349 family)
MSAHDLDDESTLVRESSSINVIDSLADALQRRVASNGGIGASQVVVDGTDQTDNVEVLEWLDCLLLECSVGHELLDQTGPLASESVCTSQTAVTTADNQGINALVDQVLGCLQSAGAFLEGHASCCSDEGTSFREPSTDVLPLHGLDHVSTLDETFVAFVNGECVAARGNCLTDNSTYGTRHSLGIASGSHDSDALFALRHRGGSEVDLGHGEDQLCCVFGADVRSGVLVRGREKLDQIKGLVSCA